MFMRRSLLVMATLVSCGLLVNTVRATAIHPRAEVRIAAFHAALAYGMPTVAGAHLHLHHVINCLVAPSNPHFDPHVLEPCRGLGHGALTDITAKLPHAQLQHVLTLALRAEASHDYPLVHKLAGMIHDELVRVLDELKRSPRR